MTRHQLLLFVRGGTVATQASFDEAEARPESALQAKPAGLA